MNLTSKNLQTRLHLEPATLAGLTVLILLSVLVELPVLVHPHWGLFDDPALILSSCRSFFSDPHLMGGKLAVILTHAEQGRYRPILNLLPFLVWAVAPENPLAYYIFRGTLFAASVCLTYLSCLRLRSSRLLSFVASLSWFALAPTYEVIYTLDKVEGYLAFAFAVVIFVYLAIADKVGAGARRRPLLTVGALTIAVLSFCACLIKETALLLAVFGVSCLVASVVPETYWRPSSKLVRRWLLCAGCACVLPAVLYKLLVSLAPHSVVQYVSLQLSPSFIAAQFMQYLKTLPVLFSLMIVTIICALKTIAVKLVNKSGVDFHFAAAAQLTLAMAAGVVALLAWPGTLMYIWLPISTFLLPALAYWLTAVSPSSLRQRLCAALLTAAFFLCLPQTFASLRFQLRMDESVHLLAAAIAQLPEITDRTKSIGTPFLTPQSTEVGESIAAYTADTMTPGFIMGQKKSPIRANFFNVIWNSRNGSQSPPDLSKVTQDATIIDRSKDHNIDPGLVTFSLDMDDRVDTKYFWWRDRLKTGDILVIPFGSMSVSTVSYRGADMFSTDWQQKLMGLPQMQVSPYMTLNAPVIFGGRQMGWTLVRITHVSPIALAIQADGWLLQNAEIAVATSCVGKVLKLRSDMLLPTKLTCGHENETRTIAGQPDGQGGLVFSIPVPKSGNGNEVILRLTCADAPPSSRDDNRPFLLHLVEASVD